MSYLITQKACELPVFRDKVMYISSSDSEIKTEQSYVISASFNGILRMSPNSYNTIYETNPVELSNIQDQSLSSSYSDAIVFDDSILKNTTENNKDNQTFLRTNADIRSRMIIVSESDGYMVSFRMSDLDVEFDNLGVIGITKTSKLNIYSSNDKGGLRIGNTLMPSCVNTFDSNRKSLNKILETNNYERNKTEQYDEIKIDITGQGDKSYLLKGIINSDGLREFEYKRSQQFIRDIIQEALLSVQSVPTGSIHWVPVTYEQYSLLVNNNSSSQFQVPNKFYKQSEISDTVKPCDPIIRDYLLCDGRKYKTEDFPELAKILWKEQIICWDSNGEIILNDDGGQYHINGEPISSKESTEYPNYFRVPDLRTKFISYVDAPSVINPIDEEPSKIGEYKDKESNQTGLYTPDNAAHNPKGRGTGEHFHFSAYGTNNEYNITYGNLNDLYHFNSWTLDELKEKLPTEDFSPRTWYLSTSGGSLSEKDSSGTDNHGSYGFAWGFGASPNRRRKQSSHDVITAIALLSAPDGGHEVWKSEPDVGLTSKSIPIYKIPENNETSYTIMEYDSFDNYIELETGISKDAPSTRYGHENAPKFYAMLPLIKI